MIHMKFQGLFSKKIIFFLECHLLQILLGALWVNKVFFKHQEAMLTCKARMLATAWIPL